jgi:hypothetical protein
MAGSDQRFAGSDAWLLLALLYAGRPASRETIRQVGDFINHAIFTDEELEGGLTRLKAAGYAAESNGLVSATPLVRQWFEGGRPKRTYVYKDMQHVEAFLSVAQPYWPG